MKVRSRENNMSKNRPQSLLLLFLGVGLVSACVTVNVYFPAAAAERVADQIICDVYGNCQPSGSSQQSDAPGEPESSLRGLLRVLDPIPAAVAAQPDINIQTPAINQLTAQMTQRHRQLTPFYASGAVGMTDNGLITVRDAAAVPLKSRNDVNRLVAEENRDRNALYAEIAKANGNPQWEPDIRRTFAARWVANAPGGWWYQSGGGWLQK
jgi:uncharacterized protein YdbL (DUF1318 family)